MKTPRVQIILKDEVLTFTSDIISFDCSENLKDADLSLKPGYVEQNASITIYDREKVFYQRILLYTVNFFHGALVEIYMDEYIVNTGTYTTVQLGKYLLDSLDVQGTKLAVTLKCIDYTYAFKEVFLPQSSVDSRTATELLDYIFVNGLKNESYAFMDAETQTRCNNCVNTQCYVDSVSVREALDQVCVFALLNIVYKNGVFYVARCA